MSDSIAPCLADALPRKADDAALHELYEARVAANRPVVIDLV